jgi:exonuclease III
MILPRSRIVALNVLSGGGSRVEKICQFLDRQKPDVIVLSEWREGANGKKFADWAASRRMVHQTLNDGSTRNGLLVASRTPFKTTSLTPAGPVASAGVLMLAQFPSWALLAGYFPQLKTKAHFFSACREAAKAHAGAPFMIVGDMNTGNQRADKCEAGSPFACDDHFDALTGDGLLVDLWRRTHGPDIREWSWLSNTRNGFRIDHAFANEPFLEAFQPACVYDHAPREERLSDHSAMIVAMSTTA